VWDFIKFPDNIDVIDLIDKSHVGILSILTEQCRTPHGTDKTFIDAIYKQCGKSERFLGRPLHQGKMQFIVSHYAGPVLYDGKDFVEKNKEEVPRGASALLESSNKGFVRLLGKITMGSMDAGPTSATNGRTKAKKRPTVASQFSSQLTDLRNRIEKTNPHYVRCLKPNQSLKPNEFDSAMIADQLRYAGVLEAIRVSRVGYSQRYTKKHFLDRYRFIAPDEVRQRGDDHSKINAVELELTKKIWKLQHPKEEA
jgi:myosin heavy subunit